VGIAEFYLYMGFGADLLKMWSREPENYRNRNPHTSKIRKLLPVSLTNNQRRSDRICERHAKFGENWQRIVVVIVPQYTNQNRNWNLHIPKN